MRKLQVDWSAGEDSFLLLSKVVGSYLCRNSWHMMVQYTAVRDLLHQHFPESKNETSKACKRTFYMLKNKSTVDKVPCCLEDVRLDPKLASLVHIPDGLELKASLEARLEPVVEFLIRKYKDASQRGEDRLELPASREELEELYNIIYLVSNPTSKPGFSKPNTMAEVQAGVASV